jgi:P-type conjugative transfer protein TrbG
MFILRILRLLLWAIAIIARAQQPATQHRPVVVHRKPPAQKQALVPSVTPPAPHVDLTTGITAQPQPKALDPVAKEAVRIAEEWRNAAVNIESGPGGTVRYTYGDGYPVLVCSPLHACGIELQPGEKIIGDKDDLVMADPTRWLSDVVVYGDSPGGPVTEIIFKPKKSDLESNIAVYTNRRKYYIGLKSTQDQWLNGISFRYPDDERRAREATKAAAAQQTELKPVLIPTDRLNFAYTVKGKAEELKPVRVYDDGEKTYFQMKPEMRHLEAPALVVLDEHDKAIMANYRVAGDTYILDRQIERARLTIGTGKKPKKVEIRKEPKRG